MKVYVTFGQVHAHWIKGISYDKDCVAVIEADSNEAGRQKAFALFGAKFCYCTPEKQFDMKDLSYYRRGLIPVSIE